MLDRRLATYADGKRLRFLFVGPAGTGKTTLARIVVKRLDARQRALGITPGPYYELLPSQVAKKELLDAFMRTVVANPYSKVFIDEVHALSLEHVTDFLPFTHDTGDLKYPMSDGSSLAVPPTVSWLLATTDPGELDRKTEGALRRRFIEIRLEPPTREVLADIVTDSARTQGYGVATGAADMLAARCVFPWQAKELYEEARISAELAGSRVIHQAHAEEAFVVKQLDEHGLMQEDRDVIAALFQAPYRLATQHGEVRYKMSETALCPAAGVDTLTYKKRIQPKLIRLGLLTTVGGQQLTDKAVRLYSKLRRE
jgi:Holliday junction resolvasome RuvABC ATP-dependent DNA helicase subunit